MSNSQSLYHISHDGKELGPWPLSEIIEKVKNNQLHLTDYIFDQRKQDWVALLEFAPLAEVIKSKKPKTMPSKLPDGPEAKVEELVPVVSVAPDIKNDKPADTEAEWFVLKGENKFGPFAFFDLVRMLQEKAVYEFDYAWHSGLATWRRIAELPEFNEESIRKLQVSRKPEVTELFFRRRHARIEFGASLIIHDNNQVWKGSSIEISPGGAGITMDNAAILPGQVLYLHFKPGDGVPPFNAIVEVVSKKFIKNVRDKTTPITYGVKFTNISVMAQQKITDYSSKRSAS